MNLKETLSILESELEKKPLFAFKIRVGEITKGAFDPQQQLAVSGNSTQEFIDNLKIQLQELPGSPELAKESEHELFDRLSDIELMNKGFERVYMRSQEEYERKFN